MEELNDENQSHQNKNMVKSKRIKKIKRTATLLFSLLILILSLIASNEIYKRQQMQIEVKKKLFELNQQLVSVLQYEIRDTTKSAIKILEIKNFISKYDSIQNKIRILTNYGALRLPKYNSEYIQDEIAMGYSNFSCPIICVTYTLTNMWLFLIISVGFCFTGSIISVIRKNDELNIGIIITSIGAGIIIYLFSFGNISIFSFFQEKGSINPFNIALLSIIIGLYTEPFYKAINKWVSANFTKST